MKIGIVGSRDFPDANLRVKKCLLRLKRLYGDRIIIVTGGGGVVDHAAYTESVLLGLRCFVIPANWEKYGKKAGPIRNKQLVEICDKVYAFWDGKSKGTAGVIQEVYRRGGKEVIIRREK